MNIYPIQVPPPPPPSLFGAAPTAPGLPPPPPPSLTGSNNSINNNKRKTVSLTTVAIGVSHREKIYTAYTQTNSIYLHRL